MHIKLNALSKYLADGDYHLLPELADIQKILSNKIVETTLQAQKIRAEGWRGEPVTSLRYADFKQFFVTGSRTEYERVYFARRDRLHTLALLVIFGYDGFIDDLQDVIFAVCEEFTWELPAHHRSLGGRPPLRDYERADGYAYDGTTGYDKSYGLFGAETGMALAEICHLLEDKLDGLIVHRARTLVRERVVEPYMDVYNSRHNDWIVLENNWSAVCSGSVGMAAIYLMKSAGSLARVLYTVLGSLDCFLDGCGDDGSLTEGLSYWNYGFGYYVFFARLLYERTNGKVDLLSGSKQQALSRFPQNALMADDMQANFSDCQEYPGFDFGLCSLLSRMSPGYMVSSNTAPSRESNMRWAGTLRDLIWANDKLFEPVGGADCFLPDAQWFISRTRLPKGYLSFAAKGGHNDESHNHNDIGCFILHCAGDTFICDLGGGTYSADYFSDKRYENIHASSTGHSVPVVGGQGQRPGRTHEAAHVNGRCGDEAVYFSMDIGGAYENDIGVRRSFVFDKAGKTLTLNDSFTTDGVREVTERFITKIKPASEEGAVTLRGQNAACAIVNEAGIVPVIREQAIQPHGRREADTAVCYLMDYTFSVTGEKDASFTFKLSDIES